MRVIQSLNELVKFGEAHKHINVYGAGVYANKILNLALKNKTFDIDAFLVSDLSVNPNTIENIPVKLATEHEIPRDMAVVISLGVDMRDEVVSYLEKEGYNDLTVITGIVRYELSKGIYGSFLEIARDKLISKYKNDPPTPQTAPKNTHINEELYVQNKQAFIDYKYMWKKTFPSFKDIDNKKITEISIKPQDKELFEQLNSNLPILLKDCYDTDWLKRMCGRLRSSEKYGSDNLLYLEYSSLDTFIAMMAIVDWREALATKKVVFIFDEHEKKEKYPIVKEKFGEIQPLAVGEITTLIRMNCLYGFSGNVFFNMIMDAHTHLLTVKMFGMRAYAVLYEKILKGHPVAKALERIKHPKNQIERNIVYRNLWCMLIFDVDSDSDPNVAEDNEFNSKFFKHLLNILGEDNVPSSIEWFKGFYLANAKCFDRKYTDRLVPPIFYDSHVGIDYNKEFHVNKQEADNWQDELYAAFDEELIITIIRDPLTRIGSRFDLETKVSNCEALKSQYKSPINIVYNSFIYTYTKYISKQDVLYKKWRIVRFEDLKLHPHETLTKLCKFLHIPKTDSMLTCTINGEKNEEYLGTKGFDPAPIYKKHDKYFGGLDRYRLEMLHKNDYKAWGYKLKYYEGMTYTPEEIKALFSLPYSSERIFSGDKELEKKLKNDIIELALYAANNDFPIPCDEDGNQMMPVKWLKPDLPEGEKLYE